MTGIHVKHFSPTMQVCFIELMCMCPGFLTGQHKQRGRGISKEKVGEERKERWAVSEGVGFVIVAGEW